MQADEKRIADLEDADLKTELSEQVVAPQGHHYDKHPCFAKRVMTGFMGDLSDKEWAEDMSTAFIMSCDDDCPTGPPLPPFLQQDSVNPSTPTPSGRRQPTSQVLSHSTRQITAGAGTAQPLPPVPSAMVGSSAPRPLSTSQNMVRQTTLVGANAASVQRASSTASSATAVRPAMKLESSTAARALMQSSGPTPSSSTNTRRQSNNLGRPTSSTVNSSRVHPLVGSSSSNTVVTRAPPVGPAHASTAQVGTSSNSSSRSAMERRHPPTPPTGSTATSAASSSSLPTGRTMAMKRKPTPSGVTAVGPQGMRALKIVSASNPTHSEPSTSSRRTSSQLSPVSKLSIFSHIII